MKLIKQEAFLPTKYGDFEMSTIDSDKGEWMPHIVLKHKELNPRETVWLRIHSECITGDLFGSKRCDCGDQLDLSLKLVSKNKGILIYLRQEGRGIGINNKLKAYNLQDEGFNTIDANVHLGLQNDARRYDLVIAILKQLNVNAVKLLTNNPEKISAFDNSGIILEERVPLQIEPNETNSDYLKTKKENMGHLL